MVHRLRYRCAGCGRDITERPRDIAPLARPVRLAIAPWTVARASSVRLPPPNRAPLAERNPRNYDSPILGRISGIFYSPGARATRFCAPSLALRACRGVEKARYGHLKGEAMRKVKILYYNWVDFEDEEERGGGVSIYQRNLVDAATRQGDEVWFLSSGVSYSPFSSRPFIREVKARKEGVRKFEVVNSTLFSPGHEAFGVEVADSPAMDTAFADFLREHGPFDVIHFNNLEGIPVSFLRLAREHYPQAKVIYSVHNYFAFCPQVNLWFQERAACRDFREGRKCVNCLIQPLHPRGTQRLYRLEYCLRKLGISPRSFVDRYVKRLIFGL